MAIFRGTPGLVAMKPERRWTRSGGDQTVLPFRGLEADCVAAVPAAKADPTVTDLYIRQVAGPTSELVVTYGNDGVSSEDELPTKYELLPEEEQKLLSDLKLYSDLEDDVKASVNAAIDAIKRGDTPVTSGFSSVPNAVLYYETAKLTDSYPVNRWVLRKTQTVSSYTRIRFNSPTDGASDLDITLRGVGTVFTSAQLVSYESGMWPSLKAAIEYYASPGNITIGGVTVFRWGWYKKLPTLNERAGQKLEAVQDYSLGYWPAIAVPAYA